MLSSLRISVVVATDKKYAEPKFGDTFFKKTEASNFLRAQLPSFRLI